ncbi:MAG: PepSY-associated TM helix domain-containing protein [Pseudomonadota bacterium]
MHTDFRKSMAWLHTWAGVILGSIMFVMFFMGTLSVFKHEIDRWMLPQTRLAAPATPVSADAIYDVVKERVGAEPKAVRFTMPTRDFPAITVYAFPKDGRRVDLFLDPATLEFTTPMDSASARFFLYPMHYRLTPMPYGRWFSAAVAMFMLTMMISGIVIHRKIFVDFFTFRPGKKLPRSSLDLHNITSVLAMPFHLLITITGVLILFGLYFTPSLKAVYPDAEDPRRAFYHALEGTVPVVQQNATNPNRIASIDAMAREAHAVWGGAELADVYIEYPDDQGGVVWLYKSLADQVSAQNTAIQFSSATGAMLSSPTSTAALTAQQWLAGTHMIFFDHWLLRWLYFFAGAAGCVMIATGFIYWMETRRKTYARNKWPGVRIVEGFAVWGVMGLMTATAAFFFVNRAFEPGLWKWNGVLKPYLEIAVFYLTWLAALFHGWARGKAAWADQSLLLGALSVGAVVLNWTSTGDTLLATAVRGDFAVAGMDAVLLCAAMICFASFFKIRAVRLREAGRLKAAPPAGAAAAE